MDNQICQLGNHSIFSNVVNYYAAHLWQLIAASLLNEEAQESQDEKTKMSEESQEEKSIKKFIHKYLEKFVGEISGT